MLHMISYIIWNHRNHHDTKRCLFVLLFINLWLQLWDYCIICDYNYVITVYHMIYRPNEMLWYHMMISYYDFIQWYHIWYHKWYHSMISSVWCFCSDEQDTWYVNMISQYMMQHLMDFFNAYAHAKRNKIHYDVSRTRTLACILQGSQSYHWTKGPLHDISCR